MGKKRRYIQRAKKFAKKAFNFLDKLDGTQDSILLSSKVDTIISKIIVADRENQTMSLQFEGMGPGSSTGGVGLEKDRVIYKIDGNAVNANGIHTFGAPSGGSKGNRSRFKTTEAAPARAGSGASDVLLTVGTHKITADLVGEAAAAASVEITFTGDPGLNNTITLISADGTSKTYSAKTSANAAAGTFDHNNGNETAASTLRSAIINGAQHDDKFTVVQDGAKLTITNATTGAAGNTDIVSSLSNVTISNSGKFTGGVDLDNTVKASASRSISIRENKIAINTAAFVDDTAGNIAIDASEVIGAGKRVAGSELAASFAQNGYKVTAKDASGNTLAVTSRANVNKNSGTDGDILASDVPNGTEVTLTITPKDNTDSLLNESAVEHTIKVTA